MSNTINVDHWPNSSFVTVNHKRPDTWFCQYTVGKIKPNYPMPAIPIKTTWQEMSISLWQYGKLVRRWYHPRRFKYPF